MLAPLLPNSALPAAGASRRPPAPAPPTPTAPLSPSGLSTSQLDGILSLAAAGASPVQQAPAPPPRGKPPSGPGPVRIAIWDETRGIKISGADAPSEGELAAYLLAHPKHVVYAGQKPLPTGVTPKGTSDMDVVKPLKSHLPEATDAYAKRSQFSEGQLARLVEEFEINELPTREHKEALADELGLPPRSVQIWFQNRRQRLKLSRPAGAARPSEHDALSELAAIAEHEHGTERESPTSAIDGLAMVSSLAVLAAGREPAAAPPAAAKPPRSTPKPRAPAPEPGTFEWKALDGSGGLADAGANDGATKRTDLTNQQLARLAAQFNVNKYPDSHTRQRLAAELGMPQRTVQVWFQNRRQRDPAREQRSAEPPPPIRICIDDALPLVPNQPSAQRALHAPASAAHTAFAAGAAPPPIAVATVATAPDAAAAATAPPSTIYRAYLVGSTPPPRAAPPLPKQPSAAAAAAAAAAVAAAGPALRGGHGVPQPGKMPTGKSGSVPIAKGGRPPLAQGLMWRPMQSLPAAPVRPAAPMRAPATAVEPAVRMASVHAPKRPAAEVGLLMLLSCGESSTAEQPAKRQRAAD